MKKAVLIIFLLLNVFVNSQNVSGDLENYIDNIIDNVPGGSGDDYKNPTITQTNIWKNLLNYILTNNISAARLQAGKLGYKIVDFTDTTINKTFYVVEKNSNSSNHWGTYVFTKNPTINNLVITAPHIINDINTGQQAVYCLKKTLAKAVFLNGTERCNSSTFSNCSGTTTTCDNGAEAFRISDVAHTEEAVFHITTDFLLNSISDSIFIQLHGFSKRVDDPYVIMSNGTRQKPATDYIEKLKNELLKEDNTLTFQIPHQNLSWDRLIAFTNTQGRLINGVLNPCIVSATTTTGRFISIEQELTKLRQDTSGWSKVSNALLKTFTNTLSLEDNIFNISITPNPTSGKIFIKSNDIQYIEIFNFYGQRIKSYSNYGRNDATINLYKESGGLYLLKVKTNKGLSLKRIILID